MRPDTRRTARRTARRTTVASVAALALLAAACSTADAPGAAAPSSTPEAPAPAPAPTPPSPQPAPEAPGTDRPARPERSGDPLPLTPESLADLTWTTDCTEDGEVREVELEPLPPDGPLLRPMRPDGRQFAYFDDPSEIAGMVFSVDLSVVASVDLDGSGAPELAVDTWCFGGNGFGHAVEVWGVGEDGWPVQLPPALRYTKFDGYVIDLGSEGDALIITMRVGAPGDSWPHLNGYPLVRVSEHRFDGTSWSMTIRSVTEQLEV
jgi:hypothetical protein